MRDNLETEDELAFVILMVFVIVFYQAIWFVGFWQCLKWAGAL